MKTQLNEPILILSPVVVDQGTVYKLIIHDNGFFGGVDLFVAERWRLVELLLTSTTTLVIHEIHDTVHVQLRMNYHTNRPKFVCKS